VRYDKQRLVALAKFIGEIRSRRIPNYRNGVRGMPPAAKQVLDEAKVGMHVDRLTPDQKQAFDKATEEGRQARLMDTLQRELFSADTVLTLFLLESCSQFPSADPANATFLKQVADAARLTDEERKRL
jgi:hypothetical protein